MRKNSKYMKMAKKLCEAHFFMAGVGHFNMTGEEVAEVFQILLENKSNLKLIEFYKNLARKKLS